MIQFNTLKITQDGKNLIINASVKNLEYYTNVLIGSIVIDNQDTYSASGPSSNPIYRHSFAGKDLVTNENIEGLKNINIIVSAKELLDNNGDLNDDINTLGVALNLRPIYNNGINYIKQVESTCEIPKDFIEFILRYKALDLALKTENYIQANKYWNKFFKNNNVVPLNTNSCGCT